MSKTKTEQMLTEAREATKPMPLTSPLHPDQVKRPKWQRNLEKPLPPKSEGYGYDPLAPIKLEGNLAKWEAFDWDRHPKLRPAKKIIVDWYNGLPNNSGALVLAGDVGCGKTHLADAIADLYGRWRISYFEEIELVKKIQATYSDKGQSEESIIRTLVRADLLILDDLGTYETKNMSWLSNLYNMIFNDYLTVKAKPLLITTNLPMFIFNADNEVVPGGMSTRIGARSFSRLCDALGKKGQGRYIDLFGINDMRVEGYLG